MKHKMTENQKNLKISYREKWRNKGWDEQEVYTYKEPENWEKNEYFEAEISYLGYIRGRSALNIQWKDSKRKRIYNSSMELLSKTLLNKEIQNSTIKGTFYFRKQGTSILLDKIYE